MARKTKGDTNGETDLIVEASPETTVTVEAETLPAAGGRRAAVLQLIRDNPIPAGMFWAGLGWLVLSGSGVKRPEAGGAQQAVTGAQQAFSGVVTRTQGTARRVATGARERGASVVGRARNAVTTARSAATSAALTARERSASQAQRARSSAQQIMTEHPIVLELAAVGAGAAVGLGLPATKQERELVGARVNEARPRLNQAMEKLDTVAEQAVDKMQQAVDQSRVSQPQ